MRWLLWAPLIFAGLCVWWRIVYRVTEKLIDIRWRRRRLYRQVNFIYLFCQQLNAERIETIVGSTRIPDDISELEGDVKRRLISGLERDAIHARHKLCFTENRHGAIVAWVKRQIHKRERREGKAEARVESW